LRARKEVDEQKLAKPTEDNKYY